MSAQRAARVEGDERPGGFGAPRAQSLPMDGFRLWRAWWADVANRRSAATADDYRGACFRFFAFTAHDPLEVSAGQIKAFLKDLRTQHANLYRHALGDFFEFLIRRGARIDNPLAEIKRRPTRRNKIKRSLTEDELARTLIAAVYMGRYRRRWEGRRMALLMLAQYYAGLRPGEIVRLTTAHLQLEGSEPYIEVTETKTDADRVVPLSARAADVFRELSHDRVGRLCEVSETTYWTWVKRATQLAGVTPEKTRPYAFRHSFARHLIDRGVPQRDVAELLGHVDLRSIVGYTVPGSDALRRAVELLP